MSQYMVVPAPGKRVLQPDGTALAADGQLVEPSVFWRRRAAQGDVTLTIVPPDSTPLITSPRPRKDPK